jgi:integrase
MREPYIIFRRPDGARGGRMFYVEFWDLTVPPAGKYIGRSSVGSLLREIENPADLDPCKKADAKEIVRLWRETHAPQSGALLLKYLEGFWLPGGEYDKRYTMEHKNKAISADYLYNNQKNVRNHFKPFLEEQKRASLGIGQVTPKLLNEFKSYLDAKRVASSTINNAIKSVFVPINDFWLQAGAPEKSPARLVSYVPVEESDRDILSIAEASKVFHLEGLSQRDRLLLQLAAFAGLRVSEACAARPERLKLESFEADGKKVEYYTYSIVEQTRGRKPKAGSSGEATLPYDLGHALLEFYETTQGKGWICDGKTIGTSMQRGQAENISNAAIAKALGLIDDGAHIREKRAPLPSSLQERGLTFHAWRHWYTSYIRPAVGAELMQKLDRHKSKKMTDHYTHLTIEEKRRSAMAGGNIFKGLEQ